MEEIIYKLKANFTLNVVIFMIIISLILYYIDRKKFIEQEYKTEEKVAKILSYIYFFGSLGLFIALRFLP
ncbi:hypothetical protein EDC18_10726 [Natranaerovirga pectinivora]|uniref:Uncharacterized protein n=1 Tax=Natranaerovirga pectinivora TaxID=682400 RepID=A0A4R3MIF0_9FIRM|nr:CLC_0170 family protein [Natranaerovirga pectinivora]TCT13957.1 hypothetical protein EDC18_10726 [Natranaerovirga pectinivora]